MKPILLFLPFLISLTTSAQTREKYFDYKWRETKPENARFVALITPTDSGWHRKDYYIQQKTLQMEGTYEDSLCKIRSGPFSYYYANGQLQRSG